MNKRVKTKSGLDGWQGYLQDQYSGLPEFRRYSGSFGLSDRLGYDSTAEAWEANPLIQGSTNPDDYCRVWESDEQPIAVKVVVELIVDQGDEEGLPEWKIRDAAEQAVENALKVGFDNGFTHEHEGDVSIAVASVETADNNLEPAY